MSLNKKIIITGKAASGKDYLIKKLKEKGLNIGIKHTTRPCRKNEINNIDYYFINNDEFTKLINIDYFIVYQKFLIKTHDVENVWYYGLSKEEFNNKDCFILTPYELSLLSDTDKKTCFIIYLDIDKDTRKKRLIERKDYNDDIYRRLKADEEDFMFFKDYDLRITDSEFNIDNIYNIVKNQFF